MKRQTVNYAIIPLALALLTISACGQKNKGDIAPFLGHWVAADDYGQALLPPTADIAVEKGRIHFQVKNLSQGKKLSTGSFYPVLDKEQGKLSFTDNDNKVAQYLDMESIGLAGDTLMVTLGSETIPFVRE